MCGRVAIVLKCLFCTHLALAIHEDEDCIEFLIIMQVENILYGLLIVEENLAYSGS